MSTLVDMTTSDVFEIIKSLLGDAALLELSMSDGDVLSPYVFVNIILLSTVTEPPLVVGMGMRDAIVSLLGDAGNST